MPGRDFERRVDHAERLEQALVEEVGERLTGNHLDDARRDVDADAVVPARAGVESQRSSREVVNRLGERRRRQVELGVAEELADREVVDEAVGETARVS